MTLEELSRLTLEELIRLEGIEARTGADARAAKMEADRGRVEFGKIQLAAAGIVMDETVCEYFERPWDSKSSRGVVCAIDTRGLAVVCPITKSGKVHKGRNPHHIKIGELAIGETA